MSEETTNERIARLGFRAEDDGNGMKRVGDSEGRCVVVGTALEVSRWLDGLEYAQGKAFPTIVDQAVKLKEHSTTIVAYAAALLTIRAQIVCIGGPLNDNVLRYSPAQLVPFQRILDETEVVQ